MLTLRGLAGSIGIFGLLYLSGYVIESSFQSLLGVIIFDPANRLYLASAGNFCFDLWQQLLAGLADAASYLLAVAQTALRQHGIMSLLRAALLTVLVSATVVLWALSRIRQVAESIASTGRTLSNKLKPRMSVILLTILVFGGLAKVTYFELPLAKREKILWTYATLEVDSSNGPWFYGRETDLWRNLVCSRATADLAMECDRKSSKRSLRAEFLGNAIVTVMLTFIGLLIIYLPGVQKAEAASGYAAGVVSVIVALVLLSLLYFYGKTLRTHALVREVDLIYEAEGDIEGYLLGESNGNYTLLDSSEHFVTIPGSQILQVSVTERSPIKVIRGNRGRTREGIEIERMEDRLRFFDLKSRKIEYFSLKAQEQDDSPKLRTGRKREGLQRRNYSTGKLESFWLEASPADRDLRKVRIVLQAASIHVSGLILAEAGDSLFLFSGGRVVQLQQSGTKRIDVLDLKDPIEEWIRLTYGKKAKRPPSGGGA